MSRIIQDSDDEMDDDLELEMHRTVAKDASPKQSASDASSTEALRRQIEVAHRAHLQSQFSVNDGQTLTTLEADHQKRKAPVEFDSHSPSMGDTASKKTLVTYGRRSQGVCGISPADLQQDCALIDQISQPDGTTNGTDWTMEGTMRDAYAQHNPNTMFPEPSSTIPNATLTQQRVMEGVLAPPLLGSDVDVGRAPFQPDASIPWSEYLKSPTNTGEQPMSSARPTYDSQNTSVPTSRSLLNGHSDPSVSQQSRQQSLTLVGCPSTQDIRDITDAQELIMFPTDEASFEAILPQATSSLTANDFVRGKTPTSSRQRRKTKCSPSPGPTSDDDLADLGLPKERYKPRPSRTRSLKVGTQESIDYSIRPEKASKASKRRKSTPATMSLTNPLSTPERIRQICEMGFTPSTSKRALKQNDGDVTQSVDWLITNQVADDELLSHTSQMSRMIAAHVDTNEINSDLNAGHVVDDQAMPTDLGAVSHTVNHNMATAERSTVLPVVDVKSPTKVQVVIPAKSLRPVVETSAAPEISRKKAKRRKTSLNQPEPIATDHAVTVAKVEKKRGRGRPKKAAKTLSSSEAVHEEEGPKEQVRDSPLLSIDGNAQPALVQQQIVNNIASSSTTKPVQGPESSQREGTTTANATLKSTPEPQELPNRPEVEPITPERIKKPTPREQPSNNKAKVPYRVGLSKRARIAPLLRVMKK